MTRVIIACAGGDAPKWGNYLGVPEHLAPVYRAPLLHRTFAQVKRWTDDVVITAPAGNPRYFVDGPLIVWPVAEYNVNEYAGSRPWWSDSGRTVLLLGDVYFTDQAMARIL